MERTRGGEIEGRSREKRRLPEPCRRAGDRWIERSSSIADPQARRTRNGDPCRLRRIDHDELLVRRGYSDVCIIEPRSLDVVPSTARWSARDRARDAPASRVRCGTGSRRFEGGSIHVIDCQPSLSLLTVLL